MDVEKLLDDYGIEDVVIFKDYDYSDAFLGVSQDNRAVYDFVRMVHWLMEKEGWSEAYAIEWIEYNTIKSLPYQENSPIVLYRLEA